MIAATVLCLDFLHALLRERGLIGLYLAEAGLIEGDAIQKQFQHTNAAVERLKNLPRGQEVKVASVTRALDDLPELREMVLARASDPLQSMAWYGTHLIDQAEALTCSFLVQDTHTSTVTTYALINLVRWQILLADEREMGVHHAAKEWGYDLVKLGKLRPVATEEQAYARLFFGLADDAMRRLYADAVTACPIDTRLADESNLRLTSNRNFTGLAETDVAAGDWFAAFSGKIDILQNVARALIARSVDLYGDAATASHLTLDADVEAHYELIRTLPLFRGLGVGALEALLRNAHMAHHDKNALLLAQGEPCPRLLILLDGWVKLYKTAPSGEESILHIAGRREALLDTNALMAEGASPVSCRALTRAWVLSLPAAAVRESAVRHRELAAALFTATHARFQKLIGQFEQVTIRTAAERVGWFLLTLSKEYGLDGQALTLPYDKALIAAYLNIKPETLSRALKDLRRRGFIVQRDKIVLPHPKALCDYCDYEIAGRCCDADRDVCPRPDLRPANRSRT
jgi:CRP-like cAMP-binding protein